VTGGTLDSGQDERHGREERANLGLTVFEPIDLHRLAEEYGIPIYCLADLADEQARAAVAYFSQDGSQRWSAALIPIGSARLIIENDTHAPVRRRPALAMSSATIFSSTRSAR